MTVVLQLYFAALLRLPRQMSKAAKLERVATVITALGLDKCKNTIIGAPLSLIRLLRARTLQPSLDWTVIRSPLPLLPPTVHHPRTLSSEKTRVRLIYDV